MTGSGCFETCINEKETKRLMHTHADCSSDEEIRFVGCRPWINYGKPDSCSQYVNLEQPFQDYSSKLTLPKGVIRGCLRCNDCQKVSARWLPEGGCRPALDTAPVFYPKDEEFKDTLKYITSIRPIAEPYGICRIIPPPSWQPPCPLRDKTKWQRTRFRTRVQQIHKLQVRESVSRNDINGRRSKRRRLSGMARPCGHERLYLSEIEGELLASKEDGEFGFGSGPEFTLEAFQKYANEFKDQYFRVQEVESNSDCIVLGGSKGRWAPCVENIEGEYWRVVEKPTEQIEVLYGADVETRGFGSGFPKATFKAPPEAVDPYVMSGWNLNNIARLPGSMLSFEEGDISGVVVPWLYIGMCFSSFCWHVEDHHFYSLNYLHWGAPKIWYGVPGYAAVEFEHAMRKHLPDLFIEQPDLLHKLVTQLSPSILKSDGVPVYRCVQQAGEFVLTFPRAYHSGFNCGFNCAEAVNVAPVDWVPHGQSATELYREQCRKTTVSHDKLLLGASREAVKILWDFSTLRRYSSASAGWHGFCGQDGLLTKVLKARVEMERVRRASFANLLKARKMDSNFDVVKERECFSCYYDLHLSAVGCECCPEKFACLEHAKQLCACSWNRRFSLYRYDVTELDILVEALGGKRNAINRWAALDMGLASGSCVTMSNTQQNFQPGATSLCVHSQKNKNHELDMVGEATHSHASTLDTMLKQNARGMMVSSSKQHEEMKLTSCASELVGQMNDLAKSVCKTDIPLSNSVHKISQVILPGMIGSFEEATAGTVFPYELSNGHSEASVYGSRLKADSFNPSKAEQLINSKDRDHQNSQLFHEDPSSFLRSKSTSTSKFSSPKGLPLTCEDGHGEDRPDCKVLPKKQDPPSANGVETVFLSDDEEDDDIGQERKKQSVQNLVRVGNFDNSHHRNGKIDVGILPAEKGTHNDATEQKEQNLKNTRGSSMPQRDYCVIAKSAMMKECAKDESQKKQHEYPKGNNSADLQSSFAGKPLSKVGTLCTLDARELQDLFPTDISIQSRDSLRPNSIDKTTLVGKHSNSEEPCSSAKTDENEATDFYVNPLSNQRNADIDCSNRLNINKDLHTARVASPCDASYNVDLLEIGAVQPRKYWYNSRTIFPKGFKSSVRFYSVVDPTQMCNYISEVLDAGLAEPLFKVTVKGQPAEVFMHVSIHKCWELVQERLNKEIIRQRRLGKQNLPSLQPPGSLDGLEMFGFTLPRIIQAIETLDYNHHCAEYWAARHSRSQIRYVGGEGTSMQHCKDWDGEIVRDSNSSLLKNLPAETNGKDGSSKLELLQGESNLENQVSSENVYAVLEGLFKRARPNELWTMHKVLSSEYWSKNWRAAFKALTEELKKL
eukprot:Gb_27431 [translate_table: standard]